MAVHGTRSTKHTERKSAHAVGRLMSDAPLRSQKEWPATATGLAVVNLLCSCWHGSAWHTQQRAQREKEKERHTYCEQLTLHTLSGDVSKRAACYCHWTGYSDSPLLLLHGSSWHCVAHLAASTHTVIESSTYTVSGYTAHVSLRSLKRGLLLPLYWL